MKFNIITFGCQMNVNDSERIVTMLRKMGYEPTSHLREGDLILFNTCTVRGGAADKVHQHLANLKSIKKNRPGTLIGIAGCVAQQEGDRLLADYPWLDIVIGTHNLHLLPAMVRDAEAGSRRSETDFLENSQRLDLFPPIAGQDRYSAFVTVMQGCDNYCSYCIVPYVRGREISRRFKEIVQEVHDLADKGVKEVVLLGQNVNAWRGRITRQGDEVGDFAFLLECVAEIPGIVQAFQDAARRALTAGFDAVEIHAAHGYLLHEFLSPLTNQRTDAYGGSTANRTRLLREVLTAVREVWPSDRTILLRISATDHATGGIDLAEACRIVDTIKDLADLVHVSTGGLVETPIRLYPGYQVSYADAIRKHCQIKTIAVGLVTRLEQVEEILGNDRSDLVALGRELLRNPYWVINQDGRTRQSDPALSDPLWSEAGDDRGPGHCL